MRNREAGFHGFFVDDLYQRAPAERITAGRRTQR
jgi:hypothetical protein